MLVDSLTTTTKHRLFKTLNPKYDQIKNKTSHYLTLSKSCQICKLTPTKNKFTWICFRQYGFFTYLHSRVGLKGRQWAYNI
jgi:hypothetical protein